VQADVNIICIDNTADKNQYLITLTTNGETVIHKAPATSTYKITSNNCNTSILSPEDCVTKLYHSTTFSTKEMSFRFRSEITIEKIFSIGIPKTGVVTFNKYSYAYKVLQRD
jgi:hypothetical protein